MAEVANQISKQLNYKVHMDDELAAVSVSGQFQDVTLNEFFSRRIFRGRNIIIQFDDEQHTLTIRSFGKKGHMTTYDKTDLPAVAAGNSKDFDIVPGVKRSNVITNKNTKDPLDFDIVPGVKRRDFAAGESPKDPMDFDIVPGVKRRNVAAAQKSTKDPLDFDIVPGVTRRNVTKQKNKKDPMDFDIVPGLKRRDYISNYADYEKKEK